MVFFQRLGRYEDYKFLNWYFDEFMFYHKFQDALPKSGLRRAHTEQTPLGREVGTALRVSRRDI